jgi:chromate transporter
MSGHVTLADLAAVFGQLSLLAFGGANAVLPEMQRQVVQVHPWMTATEFAALYALAQAAPGPNMLVTTLIGWRVAGLGGALVATLSLCAPSSLLTFGTAHLWYRFRAAPWRGLVQRGLMPVTAGLIMASAVLLTESTTTGWQTAALTGAATVVFLRTRLNPLIVLAVGAGLGVLGVLS